MSNERIAIVGIGLRYPDASSPEELWENVLAGRRAFRRLPDERMRAADYYSADKQAPDRFYSTQAAVLRDFEFDRAKYKIAGSTYRSTDLTHWLALDTAAEALADAGFPAADGLPRRATGVVLGNSLTGEFSRANVMRLRWPYVRRTVAAALAEKGWSAEETAEFLRGLEPRYKAPFPAIDEDTLAGGLANTIAGRICNYFDLAGGGYTVDGACSSSLLSIVTAANALVDGDLDVALAGGVDLSIDPFEVIGFAKTGALATGEMKVYDRDSNGFWPGEGCGIVVLMREADAIARGARIYASITGWGVSSDGKGGLTRPEAAGHRLALTRAYTRAGYGVETVSYFEGHGTGTAVGDATEIDALSGARREADPTAAPAALGTVKGNFGHTKAAAGIAGLIKAALAVHRQVIPPATGHHEPHPKLTEPDAAMYVPRDAALWPADLPVRAGVSAMGFGGINSHVALEEPPGRQRRTAVDRWTTSLVTGRQDADVLLIDAPDADALLARVRRLAELTERLAAAELTDLAGTLAIQRTGGRYRAAVVATGPADAARKLTRVADELAAGNTSLHVPGDGVFVGHRDTAPRIAFLFPGQGSGRGTAGAIHRRFTTAENILNNVDADGGDYTATEVAQPRIVAGSVAGLRVLQSLGIDADIAVGHSLGELTALSWAGALGGGDLLRLASVRGQVMAAASRTGGAMAGLAADPATAEALIDGRNVVIAGYNGPAQTVIAGPAGDVDEVCALARSRGLTATRLNVSHAFHSPLVRPAAEAMAERLTEIDFAEPRRPVVSTVTGEPLPANTDLRVLLVEQIVLPVRFAEAAATATDGADLVLEVGPGRVLSGLVTQIRPDARVLAVDTDSPSLTPLLGAVGAAYVLGVDVDPTVLFADRVVRPLTEDTEPRFLESPCEAAPDLDEALSADAPVADEPAATATTVPDGESATLDVLRRLAADRVELPLETVTAQTHPLDDLHLSSITVGHIVNEATRELGRPALSATTNYATVTLGELADMIDALDETAQEGAAAPSQIPGYAPWVRPFSVDYVPTQRPALTIATGTPGAWSLHAPPGHPLAERLRAALVEASVGDGVLLCLPASGEDQVELILRAGQEAAARPDGRFVVVQQAFGASGLARTLHLEHPSVRTTVVTLADAVPTLPADIEAAVTRVVGDVAATTGYTEVRYTDDGTRTIPVLSAKPSLAPEAESTGPSPLGAADVLLVTGGAKGITAECALAMARDSGAKLALLGRADPAQDEEVTANLSRMAAAGIRVRYERADVTSPDEVATAVGRIEAELGPVTALLHGAGRNEPAALTGVTSELFHRTLAPKIAGLRTVLDAVDADRIKLLITFGSIIGRAGLRGEAHYATANDWMTELTVAFQQEHPNARALALEWSVWSGAGMGEKLGVVEALMREGITPISTDSGIAVLHRVLADPSAGPVLVVSGRAAGLPTLTLPSEELPLTRFLDRVRVHYPGVELVTEADLTTGNDPYLADHLLEGDLLFPAVLGMEAMTQVATALTGHDSPPLLEEVEFLRPITVRPGGSTTVRLVALARDADVVSVAIRSEETAFGADHFRASVRFPRPELPETVAVGRTGLPMVPVDPVAELYGGVLFQGKRFQRLLAYRRAAARHAVAELSTATPAPWFAAFLAQDRVLADPGTRDAVMHSLQCCVPDAILLPQSIDRLYLADPGAADTGMVVMDARERSQDGDSYVYDVDVLTPEGVLLERWEGLTLRAVRSRNGAGPWVPALLGPYLERATERVLGSGRTVVVEPDPAPGLIEAADRRAQTELAVSRALGRRAGVRYRPDGRPEIDGGTMSASHGAGLTVVVTGAGRLACDVEVVTERDREDWTTLLGEHQVPVWDLVAAETGEPPSVAATRIWSGLECLRKAGVTASALTLVRTSPDGWVLLSDGDTRVATWVTTVNDVPEQVVFAVLSGEEC